MSGSGTGVPAGASVYAALTDVYPLIPTLGLLSDSPATTPTATQGESIVVDIIAEVDAHLRAKGYTTPVTIAAALTSLKTIVVYGSAAAILRAAFPVADGMGGDNGSAAYFESKYQSGLTFIDTGGLSPDLSGSTETGESVGSYEPGEADSYDSEPYVLRTTEF